MMHYFNVSLQATILYLFNQKRLGLKPGGGYGVSYLSTNG